MYQKEVPQYADLLDLIADINERTLAANPARRSELAAAQDLDRLAIERHGAIRVGTAKELNMLARMFAIFGMEPVGYYDLSAAGVPVHSTAFRLISADALAQSPFRVFTSLLRLEQIEDSDLRAQAESILAKRDIFTPCLGELVSQYESKG